MSEVSSSPTDGLLASSHGLSDLLNNAQHHLQHLTISCDQISTPSASFSAQTDPKTNLRALQLQVAHLQTQLLASVTRREDKDVTFRQAAQYATAKGSANGVLHALFDQASAGKTAILKTFVDTGSIPTRDGLRHWKLDLCTIRNEMGATLLHVAVGVSTARQKVKVKLVHLLVDSVGFDPNVRNVFGQTPLHVAAMGGYAEVVQALLDRGGNPIAQDRSGLTALSLVRTLSRPPEEVVQILVDAESAAMRSSSSRSESIPLSKALASALFLRGLSQFTLPHHSSAFCQQTATLVNVLLEGRQEGNVTFDKLLREYVPMLFDVVPTCQVVRLDTIFANSLYSDSDFIDELRLEADSYELSLVLPTLTSAALAGPTWMGVLLKLVQRFKVEMAEPALTDFQVTNASVGPTVPCVPNDKDVVMKVASDNEMIASPLRRLSMSSSSTSRSVDARSTLYYADQATSIAKTREVWYYAVLFKASTYSFPGTLSVTPESDVAVSSEDVSKYFPLEDHLLIGSAEYFATEYDPQTREIRLDRNYDGKEAATVKAYLTGACSSQLPPYIALKRIWERQPGNKYEDQMSSEQELFQDYQLLDPENEYEVAMKLGPIPSVKDAKDFVAEWKRAAKQIYDARECKSDLACCKHYCPQRYGHSLCLGTVAVIGQGLAKRRLGRPTFAKPLKPRASLQRLRNRFKGTEEWPGSVTKVTPMKLTSPP
ncbi:unnamed protein product [Peronospora farinosa]|uniref:Ankyrin repeat protein n=1 Tax=Peronospora farinosa TaxID=134698 RepID=A0AAV0SRE4_9STRA|nr:unnamed protein product [Peronospora farinosa]CAI5706444.1 unnamed protein product [Peronospora farinosa]